MSNMIYNFSVISWWICYWTYGCMSSPRTFIQLCFEIGTLMRDFHYTIHVLCSLHLYLKICNHVTVFSMLSGIIHAGKTLLSECVTWFSHICTAFTSNTFLPTRYTGSPHSYSFAPGVHKAKSCKASHYFL